MKVIKQPVWGDENQTYIVLNMISEELGEFEFVAYTNDCVEQGRELFSRAVSKEFGEILPYKPHVPTDEELAGLARDERNQKLLELDKAVSNPIRYASFTENQKAELAEYRQALLDVPQQDGFPNDYTIPETPMFI